MISMSFFKHNYDNQQHMYKFKSWDEFVRKFKSISEKKGYKPRKGEYGNSSMLWSPAVYKDGDTRANDNVVGWYVASIDIDDTDMTLEQVQDKFRHFTNIIHSSPSCTDDKLKCRVILLFHKFADADNLRGIRYGLTKFTHGAVDKQTNDKARIYFVPGRYNDSNENYRHFFIVNNNKALNWESLIKKYPCPPESEKYKELDAIKIIKQKTFLLNNPRPVLDILDRNCKVVNKKMIDEYRNAGDGNFHRALYLFYVKVCYSCQKIGYPISINELANIGQQLDQMDGGWYDEKRYFINAQCALEYIK